MSRWHDIIDWIGGYPYEFASPKAITEFYSERGFDPVRVEATGGLGCNQFVLRRDVA